MKLLGNRLLVNPIKKEQEENKTASGIILGTVKLNENTKNAVVSYIGNEVLFTKIGDTVMIPDGCNLGIEIDGESYILISEKEVVCVL